MPRAFPRLPAVSGGPLLIIFLLALGAAASGADSQLDISLAAKMREPPLTQADIDLFVRLFSAEGRIAGQDGEDIQITLERYFLDFAKENKITSVRLAYLAEKIPAALFHALDPALPIEDYLVPNEAETKLLLDSRDRIIQALRPPEPSGSGGAE
jgi:hypothetical protein